MPAETPPTHPPPTCTREAFAASYGLAVENRIARVERCGCTGNATCRGWQLVAPGTRPLYEIPV